MKHLLRSCIMILLVCGSMPLANAQDELSPIQEVQTRLVKIFGAGGIGGLHSYSTGFIISPDGYIATVWSHVLDPDVVTVVLGNGLKLDGRIVGAEPQLHLAILKVDADDLPYFDLDDAASAGTGQRVLAFGNMYKVATGDEPVSVMQGVIAAKTRLRARRGAFEVPFDGPVYVVDAITNNPGMGGGVLTTRDGRLLAMIGKELRNAETNTWINYAIPVDELADVAHQIKSGTFRRSDTPKSRTAPPQNYRAIDFGIVLIPDVLNRTPAYIDSLLPGSDAAQQDLRPDDLLLFINGELIQSCKELEAELGRLEESDIVQLVVRRGDSLVSVELEAPEKDEP
ncbi:Putative serine protease HtrA [Symmachiella dynata]|uniref:Serine protease HtrA n=1 Tax=Symmachiella dynata TaxID=2527995 RepID=A0A517ZSG7_9PLAN|nr:S1C family serine protease [Symmachiella dynata]QDU45393.1 Putative serine protease HtrA [Symmachiella dynata]